MNPRAVDIVSLDAHAFDPLAHTCGAAISSAFRAKTWLLFPGGGREYDYEGGAA